MDTQPCSPDETFTRDLAELDRELDARRKTERQEKTISPLAGLIAGMTHIGRPAR